MNGPVLAAAVAAVAFGPVLLYAFLTCPPSRRVFRSAWLKAQDAWYSPSGILRGIREDASLPAPDRLAGAIARHPSAPKVPGLPADGRPLDGAEVRVLGRIEMDSMISVPEPTYDRRPR